MYRISSVIPCMKCDYYCNATMATGWSAIWNEKHSIFMVVLHQGYETDKLNNTIKQHTRTKMRGLDLTSVCSSAGNIKTTKPKWVKKDLNNRSWVSTVQTFKKKIKQCLLALLKVTKKTTTQKQSKKLCICTKKLRTDKQPPRRWFSTPYHPTDQEIGKSKLFFFFLHFLLLLKKERENKKTA